MIAAALISCAVLGTVAATPAQLLEARAPGDASRVADIPALGLGTWQIGDMYQTYDVVRYAVQVGYRHVETATSYNNEITVGGGLCDAPVDREDVWVTSKLWNTAHRNLPANMAVEKTIGDLSALYLDLYLIHWPVAFKPGTTELDDQVSLVETWRTLEELVRWGRTRHIGVSNFAPADLETILSICEICPYAHEFELHPYLQQQEFVDWHLERGIKVIAHLPLGNTADVESNLPPLLEDPFWQSLAERKNATVAQTVLAWGIQRGTTVIPRSTEEELILGNLEALEIDFSEEELREVASQDKKTRFNNPGREWGVDLFKGLDDPTNL
ncbi:hypothetical protein S40288_00897 [Stachybotrys chartarum IBT 40288]|nr:hypothetical protein S40288_00897 [Stachybotrys chartarum IBT 40288]